MYPTNQDSLFDFDDQDNTIILPPQRSAAQGFDVRRLRASPRPHGDGPNLTSVQAEERHMDELFRMHCVAFELSKGDALVFIDFPKIGANGLSPTDCGGIPYNSQEFRVHSEKLLATGSPKFAEMLQASYQFRVQRRRKLVNKLPDGVKYVIDLTPPSEGDDMVFQMTELSLTPGVIKWWQSYASQGVDFYLVKGHDDCCVCKDVKARPGYGVREPMRADIRDGREDAEKLRLVIALPPTPRELSEMKEMGQREVTTVPEYYRIPDYCPIRHRNGIIRLLMLIEDREVVLDSAARMWTLVALGKIWECTSVVAPIVCQWLLHRKNSRFIEVLPEEALKVGFALENTQITQCAFQILVNEMALEEAATPDAEETPDLARVTIFGRRKGDVDDELKNLVQHAARALVDRVSKLLTRLQCKTLFDDWDIPEWHRLTEIEQALDGEMDPTAQFAFEKLQQMRMHMRRIVSWDVKDALLPSSMPSAGSYHSINQDRARYVEPQDYKPFESIMELLNPVQRLLTPFPYKELDKLWERLFVEREAWRYTVGQSITALDEELEDALIELKCRSEPSISPESRQVIFGTGELFPTPHLRCYSLLALDRQVKDELKAITSCCIRWGAEPHPNITRHLLLMLQTNELKYLPLWAGGNNDGTGGVFEDYLPPAEMGPSGPGPGYHTGATVPSAASSLAGSFVDEMSDSGIRGSTTAASVDVHDSISTVYRPDHVIADDKSIASEAFSSDFSDYQEVRRETDNKVYSLSDSDLPDDHYMEESDDDYASTIGADDFDMDDTDELDSDADAEHVPSTKDHGIKAESALVIV